MVFLLEEFVNYLPFRALLPQIESLLSKAIKSIGPVALIKLGQCDSVFLYYLQVIYCYIYRAISFTQPFLIGTPLQPVFSLGSEVSIIKGHIEINVALLPCGKPALNGCLDLSPFPDEIFLRNKVDLLGYDDRRMSLDDIPGKVSYVLIGKNDTAVGVVRLQVLIGSMNPNPISLSPQFSIPHIRIVKCKGSVSINRGQILPFKRLGNKIYTLWCLLIIPL